MPTAVAERTQVSTEFDARVLAAKTGSLRTYAKAVHRLEFDEYQDAWAEALETLDRTVIVCPPDTFKTTTIRCYIEREIGRNSNIRILWLQNAGEQALKNVMTVQQTIESNSVYRAAFGVEEDPNLQWTKSVLYVRRDLVDTAPTLMGSGLNGPYQGLHFDIIILDDPTNQEDVLSPTTMSLQESKLRGVIVDRVVDSGRIFAQLTRWGENDLVPVLASMGFTVIEMPIIADYPWGPTLSPRRFTAAKIEALRRDKGPDLFDLTYMCNAAALKGVHIKREHIQYWTKETLPENPLQFVMGIDPAASVRTQADYTAMATVGIDMRTRVMYLVEMWAKRLEVPDLELEIIKRGKRVAGLRAVGLETVGFQISLFQSLKRRNVLPMIEIPYRTRRQALSKVVAIDKDKIGRALYLDSLFASGRLLIPRGLPLLDGISLEAELCAASPRHDDRRDALSFACVMAESLSSPQIRVRMRAAW